MLRISIPLRTGRGLNDRKHWADKARTVKAERDAIGWVLNGKKPPPMPCTVTIARLAPSNGLDLDNLQGAMKAVRDSVADWLGVDDADPRVTWHYAQRRETHFRVEVEIR